MNARQHGVWWAERELSQRYELDLPNQENVALSRTPCGNASSDHAQARPTLSSPAVCDGTMRVA
jgi:hypothetical protein